MEESKQLFKKLRIYSLLDLALLLPGSYNDTTLSSAVTPGKVHTFEAIVKETHSHNGKLVVTFMLPKFSRTLQSMFFRTTPYHYQTFAAGSRHTIQGRVELYRGHLQMSQPKSLSRHGEITPKYKSAIKQDEMRGLMKRYLSEKTLIDEGLLPKEADLLMHLHFPEDLTSVYQEGSFRPEIVETLKFVEAYNHIRKLAGKRTEYPAMASLGGEVEGFVAGLPFDLTREQQRVIAEVRSDLSRSDKAARRLIVGDVGSGKTMVILAAAMTALPHRSILMAPTSLLAMQLYEEAVKHLPADVKVALVMQNREEGEYREADFIIGTHALLYREDLPGAALVMVDEQHRFGTQQRHLLELLASEETEEGGEKRAHFLQFSATPIPRTQAMMDSALIDVSLIEGTPFKKRIETRVIGRPDFPALLDHIKSETARKHQVLIIYPLVEESETIAYQSLSESRSFWESRFDNVYVTHGKDKEKEEVLLSFRERGDILLATTVVEVGISLPRLTLIVIVGAERLGLATLHQLRGRVGRHGQESWCYLFTNTPQSERLKAFTRTNNGFDIAKLDLKFREGGDILDGTMQSGQKFRWLDLAEDEAIVTSAKDRVGYVNG